MTVPFTFRSRYLLQFLFLSLLVGAAEWLVTHSAAFQLRGPVMALAVTVDLTVGIPALYYFFVARRYQLPLSTVAVVFTLSLGVAAWLLPPDGQQYVGWLRNLLLVAEPLLTVLVLVRLRGVLRAYRAARLHYPDFTDNLASSFRTVFGSALAPVVSEVAMFRYALLFWLTPAPLPASQSTHSFSMHRESAFTAIMATLLLVSVVEMTVVHLLVMRWHPGAAWALLGLSAYSLLFVLGHLHAVRQRPVLVQEQVLMLRVGLLWRVRLPRAAIASAVPIRELPALPELLNLAGPLVTAPNVLLTLHEPVAASGPYGLRKKAPHLALYVDEPARLLAVLATPAQV
ncbi:hypothetical protein LJY25_10955 [Hymenobacter sp. BT175]|uniref:hypothetical protein n=1 Tax=Hymenobacter translucens TaxID=2886507 RepID=UPI001D0E1AA8|nr:hypothetical protein [Hymenobacter translucens]MCC2546965.1 hypothetical protein [Hymenobacter translucens]